MKLHPRLTAEGVVLARRGERFRPVAERDGRGWVVGYSHRASARGGARVSEADALALLTYDLSQSAGRVEPLLARPVSQPLFDALNALAFRLGPEAFADSDVLRRVNAGEPVTPAEVSSARVGDLAGPPSAVTAAAQAVRDRLEQVLAEPEPPPPRPPREPWREPAPVAGVPTGSSAEASEPEAVVSDFDFAAVSSRTEDEPPPAAAAAPPPPAEVPAEEPPPPRFRSTTALEAPASAPREVALSSAGAAAPAAPGVGNDPPEAPAASAGFAHAPAPTVGFARGGRARLWERVRADPRVYLAVGACGLALFLCALLGFLLGRPTAPGLALGVVGVICLAPAVAFFLHRRAGGGEGG